MTASLSELRARLHEVIFEADTPAGRLFDLLLLVAIVASVIVVMLESVASIRVRVGRIRSRRCGLPMPRASWIRRGDSGMPRR